MAKFVHLHVHSHYSLLDGLGKIPELVEKAVLQKAPALAITDHGAMYGAVEFYKTCKGAGIKPILGMETYIAPRKLTDKTAQIDTKPYHLVLLAKNYQGYLNLIKLTSIAHTEGYYYKPRIDRETIKKYSKGLIASTACLAGEIPRNLLTGNLDEAEKLAKEYQAIFGKDDFYLELQDHPEIPEQAKANKLVIELAKKIGAPLIVTNDVHYVNTDDHEAHDVLLCVQTGKTMDDHERMTYDGDFSMREPDDLAKAFKEVPEAIANTVAIAEKCNIELPFGENLLPDFPLPKGEAADSHLKKLCEEGIKKRYSDAILKELKISPKSVNERLVYELDTITNMGFASYFLIVADFVNYAKANEIQVGPGRGSAAGSIVSYLLGITDIDPLKYNLLFERFLNPDRIEMPDIDLDFADTRRSEVIQYVRHKYGETRVAGIITFGTMAARAAARDVGRALGIAYSDVDKIAKIIPPPVQGRHIPILTSVKENAELRTIYGNDPKAKRLLDLASRLEGTVRHASQHASAFVISKGVLTDHLPVQLATKGELGLITQYSMYPVAELGLLKMDFLGLKNLTVIENALEIIEAVYKDKIDIHHLPLDDKPTFELLARAHTTGVFQLESSGMKRYIKDLRPTELEDITAMVALYRPGPMQFIDSYIARKHGREQITYPHPLVEKALEETYGIAVYQEQAMQIAKDFAGFTGGQADTLRKAIGKKIPKLMAQMKEKFIEGAKKFNNIPESKSREVFKMLEDFAAYGFNKSHAACYAMIAYQTAYLKAHYPECFMAALMTSDLDDLDRIRIEIEEAERLGISVLPANINESFVNFGVVKDTKNIRFGLGAIKNVGEGVAEAIVKVRKSCGPYKDLADFIRRLNDYSKKEDEEAKSTFVNKKVLEALAKSGAFDSIVERNQVLLNIDLILKFSGQKSKQSKNQIGLFGAEIDNLAKEAKLELPETPPATKRERLAWEKELLGIYLSEHPLRELAGALRQFKTTKISDLTETKRRVRVAGILTAVKKIMTRNKQQMVFAMLEDLSGKVELVVFPKVLAAAPEQFQPDSILLVTGPVDRKDGSLKLLVDSVEKIDPDTLDRSAVVMGSDATEFEEIDLTEEPEEINEHQNISVPDETQAGTGYSDTLNQAVYLEIPAGAKKEILMDVKDILDKYPGDFPVVLLVPQNGNLKKVATSAHVEYSDDLQTELRPLLGPNKTKLE